MKTKDLYLVVCWDCGGYNPYKVEKAFTSKPLLIKYLKHNFDFDSTKQVHDFINFDDVYQVSEDIQYYVEKVPFTYDESSLRPNQFINVLVKDFGDYRKSIKAFSNMTLRDEYLDKSNIKCTNLYPDVLIGNNNTFNKYRIENSYLYK